MLVVCNFEVYYFKHFQWKYANKNFSDEVNANMNKDQTKKNRNKNSLKQQNIAKEARALAQ